MKDLNATSNESHPAFAGDLKGRKNPGRFNDCCERLVEGSRVFVDTSEFVDADFAIDNPAFKAFCNLCEKRQLTLLTTNITRREINARIKLFVDQREQLLNRVIGALPEPDAQVVKTILKRNTGSDDLAKNIVRFFEKCNAVDMAIPSNAVEHVFNLYFERKPPFGGKDKKSEFPDAFVLQALQEEATRKHLGSVYVVSADGDFEAACQAQPDRLICLTSLSRLLNLVNARNHFARNVHATIENNFRKIKQILKDILESLPAELEGSGGTAQLNAIQLDDIFEILVVSCGKTTASVQFVCNVEVDASLEVLDPANTCSDFRNVHRMEVLRITLELQFDPRNVDVFTVPTYWAPVSLRFSLHE